MLYITLKDPKIASKLVQLGGDINVNYPYKFLSPQKTIFLKLTPPPQKKKIESLKFCCFFRITNKA